MFQSCAALHILQDEQRLLVRGGSELTVNSMKINKKSKGDRMRRDAQKIIFTVMISSVTFTLQSHPREQMYSKKHLGK